MFSFSKHLVSRVALTSAVIGAASFAAVGKGRSVLAHAEQRQAETSNKQHSDDAVDDDDTFLDRIVNEEEEGTEEEEKKKEKQEYNIPDAVQLGRSTWLFLHTMAAAYPKHPTPQQQEDMKQFMRLFAEFYPCRICAEDFKDVMQKIPVRTTNRLDFSKWMCEAHNEVNIRLGKEVVSCDDVLQRWGHGGVDDAEEEEDDDDDEGEDDDCSFCAGIFGKERLDQLNAILKTPPKPNKQSSPSSSPKQQAEKEPKTKTA